MKIVKALVRLNRAADKISLFTDLPCSFVYEYEPKQPNLILNFEATYDTGADYVRRVFDVEPEIIDNR